jgi:hypothetical protein
MTLNWFSGGYFEDPLVYRDASTGKYVGLNWSDMLNRLEDEGHNIVCLLGVKKKGFVHRIAITSELECHIQTTYYNQPTQILRYYASRKIVGESVAKVFIDTEKYAHFELSSGKLVMVKIRAKRDGTCMVEWFDKSTRLDKARLQISPDSPESLTLLGYNEEYEALFLRDESSGDLWISGRSLIHVEYESWVSDNDCFVRTPNGKFGMFEYSDSNLDECFVWYEPPEGYANPTFVTGFYHDLILIYGDIVFMIASYGDQRTYLLPAEAVECVSFRQFCNVLCADGSIVTLYARGYEELHKITCALPVPKSRKPAIFCRFDRQ